MLLKQDNRGDQPPIVNEEVDQRRLLHGRHQRDSQTLRVEDVEKLMNDQLRDLKVGGALEDALRREVDQVRVGTVGFSPIFI